MIYMERLRYISLIFAAAVLLCAPQGFLRAQGSRPVAEVISFDDKIHDFGDVLIGDGPVSHTFRFRNTGDADLKILNVISSCGCTTPLWPAEPVAPGAEGEISVTFTNDQGPYPFDKTLTVYVSGAARPEILHIRGVAYDKFPRLEERFPQRLGRLGFRNFTMSIGHVAKGTSRTDRVRFANLSDRPLTVEAVEASAGLSAKVEPNPVPPHEVAYLICTVDSRRVGDVWGRTPLQLKFSVEGRIYPAPFTVLAYIRDDFSTLNEEQIAAAGVPSPVLSYAEIGEIAAGTRVDFSYTVRNTGKGPLLLRKVDWECDGISDLNRYPIRVKPGAQIELRFRLDTAGREGDVLDVLTLLTDSPDQTIVNLFVSGYIKK